MKSIISRTSLLLIAISIMLSSIQVLAKDDKNIKKSLDNEDYTHSLDDITLARMHEEEKERAIKLIREHVMSLASAAEEPSIPNEKFTNKEAEPHYYYMTYGIVSIVLVVIALDVCYLVDGKRLENEPYYIKKSQREIELEKAIEEKQKEIEKEREKQKQIQNDLRKSMK